MLRIQHRERPTDIAAPDDPPTSTPRFCSLAGGLQSGHRPAELDRRHRSCRPGGPGSRRGGMNEVRLARLLGWTTARTLRRWLGKKRSAEQ